MLPGRIRNRRTRSLDDKIGTGTGKVAPEDSHKFGINLDIADRVLGLYVEVPGLLFSK
jgi:hypothetical protein